MAIVNFKRKTQALSLILISFSALACAQTLQLHFDPRHTLDPKHNHQNFPTIYFEYFKSMDTLGSFFIKTEDDLQGANHNAGKFYT
ncbi:MAG: hypothetical protein JST32_16620, partial [Bacteroidetes bacterium]|nr:hypothetical protein [Bacteroidota bacterium]